MELTFRLIAVLGRLFYRFSDGTLLPAIRGGDGDTVPLTDLLPQADDLTALDDDALATLDADITAAAETVGAQDVLSDQELADLVRAGEVVQLIRAEAATRLVAADERAEQARAALAVVRGEDADGGDGEDADEDSEDEDAGEGEGEGGATTTTTTTTEVEPPADADAEVEQTPEQIAAAARTRPPISRMSVRRPASTTPRPTPTPSGDLASLGLVASANAPGVVAGARITTYDQLAAAFISAVESTKGYRHGPPVKVPIVRAGVEDGGQYPDHMRLGADMAGNMRRIESAQRYVQEHGGQRGAIVASAMNALPAAGGICAPQQVNYDMPTLGSDARPMRDGFMTRFGADRGGVRTLPMPLLAELDGAIDVWTEATDADPGGDTKPCLTVTCPDEDETIVEAITRCLEYGNFRARYFPEQIEAWMRLATVNQARFAEQRLLAKVATGSTAVTSGQLLGTVRDVLAALDRAIAVWRYRHRLADNFTLEFAAPRWLRDQIRADIARQLPVGTVAETLVVADAEIDAFFRGRSVSPTWLMDGESGQRFTVQGVNALQGWPSTVKTYLAPSGSWLFLDGGTLDLGIVRDSTLNSTNDVQVFAETFEGAHFHGPESWTLTFDTCPDGSVAATQDTAGLCLSGS